MTARTCCSPAGPPRGYGRPVPSASQGVGSTNATVLSRPGRARQDLSSRQENAYTSLPVVPQIPWHGSPASQVRSGSSGLPFSRPSREQQVVIPAIPLAAEQQTSIRLTDVLSSVSQLPQSEGRNTTA